MLVFILSAMISASILYSFYTGDTGGVSAAALTGCGSAVSLCIDLAGAMALWGGLMAVAEKCGITQAVNRVLQKPLGMLFKGLPDPAAKKSISLNITANLLGLGNAATPLGIAAMKELCKQPESALKRRHIDTFILLNTASIQLIPMTVSAMRLEHGAPDPWDCTLPTILTSACTLGFGLVLVRMIFAVRKGDAR